MNFKKLFIQGQRGRNQGIPLGLKKLSLAINNLQRGTLYGVAAAPKCGKCLGIGTKVILYDLSKKNVEDLIVGDLLLGLDGKPNKITSLARGKEMMYWVHQSKAMSYRVNESHILSLSDKNNNIRNISITEYLNQSFNDKRNRSYGYKSCTIQEDKELSEISVIKDKVDDYYGFTLENEDKRFYLEDFTVTHNTTFVDSNFLLPQFEYYLKHKDKLNVEWLYFSYEITRVRKEFRVAPYFFKKYYNIETFSHKDKVYRLTSDYLLGKLTDQDGEIIKIKEEHLGILKEIYAKYIIPLFGEYDEQGKQLQKGLIHFYEHRDNPTGIFKTLEKNAELNGTFLYQPYTVNENGKLVQKQAKIGYIPNDPNKYTIVIIDHLRKLKHEKGYDERETINKMIEYQVELRNLCNFTFVDIIHLNRNLADIDRIKYIKDNIYPTGDDIKGSGNLSEEADVLITLFNPLDEKYNLERHFDVEIKKYPNYRSIHVVESRDTECPVHFGAIMDSEAYQFIPIRSAKK
jgi:hypothetical protein